MTYNAATETVTQVEPSFVIPKLCRAGVVVGEGPDFRVVSHTASKAGKELGK
jgi:hypothetical protein